MHSRSTNPDSVNSLHTDPAYRSWNGTRSQSRVMRRSKRRITRTAVSPVHPTIGFPVAMDCRDLTDVHREEFPPANYTRASVR